MHKDDPFWYTPDSFSQTWRYSQISFVDLLYQQHVSSQDMQDGTEPCPCAPQFPDLYQTARWSSQHLVGTCGPAPNVHSLIFASRSTMDQLLLGLYLVRAALGDPACAPQPCCANQHCESRTRDMYSSLARQKAIVILNKNRSCLQLSKYQ